MKTIIATIAALGFTAGVAAAHDVSYNKVENAPQSSSFSVLDSKVDGRKSIWDEREELFGSGDN